MVNAAFYNKAAATADRLIRKFGAPGKLQRSGVAEYDPDTSTTVAEPGLPQAIVAAVFSYDEELIDGELIQRGDKQAFLSVKGLQEAKATDLFMWPDSAPETYTVIKHKELGPAGINVLFELQVRK